MKLSKKTLAVLKNFAGINQSIIIKEGNNLETISNVKDIFANVEVEETFDRTFAIYDLNEFLGVVSLFEDPDFEFNDNFVKISEGSQFQNYYYADPSVITAPPEKGVTLPSVEVKAVISKEELQTLVKAASANAASDLTFENGSVRVHDKSKPNSNSFEIGNLADHNVDYSLSIGVEKIKMVVDDYQVEICSKGLSRFMGSTSGIQYFVALQPDGKYGS